MRIPTSMTAVLIVLALSTTLAAQPPLQKKVMITEVCPYGREAVELFNFDTMPIDLAAYTIRWRFNNVTYTSTPLGFALAPDRPVVIHDASGGPDLGVPTWISQYGRLPSIIVPFGASVSVALVNGTGAVTDEVRILGFAPGAVMPGALGGIFRGLAQPCVVSSGTPSVERIWGLDSDSAGDWCRAENQTMGRMNTCSGPRTADTIPLEEVVLSEIEIRHDSFLTANDTIELHVRSGVNVNLQNWFLLMSGAQGTPFSALAPWPGPAILPAGAHIVLYENGSLSTLVSFPEMPAGTFAYNVGSIPLGFEEFTVALYDDLGRLVDLVRTTGHDDQVLHNHPRAPGAWNDFLGHARRNPSSRGIARNSTTGHIRNGSDWRPTFRRTMGFANGPFTDGGGDSFALDVRLDEGFTPGQGLFYLVNAGANFGGSRIDLLVSTAHSQGLGPIAGLGVDCLQNFMTLNMAGISPVAAFLDASGAFRFMFPPASLPPGLVMDTIAVISHAQLQGGASLTKVLEFDA